MGLHIAWVIILPYVARSFRYAADQCPDENEPKPLPTCLMDVHREGALLGQKDQISDAMTEVHRLVLGNIKNIPMTNDTPRPVSREISRKKQRPHRRFQIFRESPAKVIMFGIAVAMWVFDDAGRCSTVKTATMLAILLPSLGVLPVRPLPNPSSTSPKVDNGDSDPRSLLLYILRNC